MLTASTLVEFLLSLLRDDELRGDFLNDPQSVLAQHGFSDLCTQDVTDALPLLADRDGVQATGGAAGNGAADPVAEITHVTNNFEADKSVPDDGPDSYNVYNVDDRDTIINVDDRDTVNIEAAGDVTIEDSFNQDNDVNVIEDSFNEDNDGVDNKGGTIDDGTVAGDDMDDSLNSDEQTTEDSHNTDDHSTSDSHNSDDDTATDSFNEDNDGTDADVSTEAEEPEEPAVTSEESDSTLPPATADDSADDVDAAAEQPIGI